jgi:alkaline phosphatase D
MKITQLSLLFVLIFNALQAQDNGAVLLHNDRVTFRNGPVTFNPEWKPFYHGVASGDPLEDRVIIWTRVTPDTLNNNPIQVTWRVATDTRFSNVVRSGTFTTDASRDYTVKVDVTGLQAGSTYYYVFNALGKNSLVGRTKTTPTGTQVSQLKFAVASCSNFQAGYFTNYRHIAVRNDLDAVLHLGDYIYEYANGVYGDSSLQNNRKVEPDKEIITLADYRTRYSTYRLDTNLVRAHQQHPFITVWDDHESANNAYKDGAENHTPATEGDWNTRKAISKQVYFEWMPIRDNSQRDVYRKIKYGNLLDLIMIDTRLKGRELQINDINDPALQDTNRTILGAEQKAWLFDQLRTSTARWKVIGQQVTFAEFNVGWAALLPGSTFTFESLESLFLDFWDGYPAERTQVLNFIKNNNIKNVVILTGDVHASFAYDVADKPVNLTLQTVPGLGRIPFYTPSPNYVDSTGAGAVAVEFVTPSITSANFDENVGLAAAQALQLQINRPISASGVNLGNPNPHMKYNDLIRHGYFILDVKADSAQANWYYAPILQPGQPEAFGAGYYTKNNESRLRRANGQSNPKAVQDEPAPNNPLMTTSLKNVKEKQIFAILGVYPNPFDQLNTLHYSLSQAAQVRIGLFDINGKLVRTLVNQRMQPGIFSLQLNAGDLAQGTYIYKIQINEQIYTAKVVLTK